MQWGRAPTGSPPAFQLVAIAASAGGLSALTTVLAHLPRTFPLPVAIVQHVDPRHESLVADILARRTPLTVKRAEQDDLLTAGIVYVAPPGSHMEIDANGGCRRIQLAHTQPVHFVRPSADRLFESAALSCGPIIGVVLTGSGSDGALGARAIKNAGGLVIVQNQESSEFFGMPQAAIESGAVDLVLPLGDIAGALLEVTGTEHS
jgi:two-component system chemotaxis response regulator CheB